MDDTSLILLTEEMVGQASRKGFRLVPLELDGQRRTGLLYFDFCRFAQGAGLKMDQAFYLDTMYEGVYDLDRIAARLMAGEDVGPGASQMFQPGTRINAGGRRGTVLGWSAFGRRRLFVAYDYRDGECGDWDLAGLWRGSSSHAYIAPNREHQPRGWPFRPMAEESDSQRRYRLWPAFLHLCRNVWPQVCAENTESLLTQETARWIKAYGGLAQASRNALETETSASVIDLPPETALADLEALWQRPEVADLKLSGPVLELETVSLHLTQGTASHVLGRFRISVRLDGGNPPYQVVCLDSHPQECQHPLVNAQGFPLGASLDEALPRLIAARQYPVALGILLDFLSQVPEGSLTMMPLSCWPTVQSKSVPASGGGQRQPLSAENGLGQRYLQSGGFLQSADAAAAADRKGQATRTFAEAQAERRRKWNQASGRMIRQPTEDQVRADFDRLVSHPEFISMLTFPKWGLIVFTRPLVAEVAGVNRNFGCQAVLMVNPPDGPAVGVYGFDPLDDEDDIRHPLVNPKTRRLRVSEEVSRQWAEAVWQGRFTDVFGQVVEVLKDVNNRRGDCSPSPLNWPEAAGGSR